MADQGRRTWRQRVRRMLLAVYGPAQVSPPDPRDDEDRRRQLRGRRTTSTSIEGDDRPEPPGTPRSR